MFKYLVTLVFIIILMVSVASASPLQKGDKFPNVELKGELKDNQIEYLGLQGAGPWKIADIDADYIVVEVFSMYCPHCQKEAPYVNKLHDKLLKIDNSKKIKIIGIGAGNSEFEINFFKEKFKIDLPLFSDADLNINSNLGGTGTPHFFLVKMKDSNLKTVYSHPGRMKNCNDFLKKITNITGR
ncbi:peroxiredoxin family protein [Maridesulfovibrio zosterae]|uniref:peroxiredoxin family protein n=1 Tax=Maridesulfovibrio zosterae TaxID=82171 RepID=UPI000488AC8D|nr:TlpA disulfide reductase family protein [Maridesulfovibrio zosterae]